MKTLDMTTAGWGRKALMVGSIGALLGAAACGASRELPGAPAQASVPATNQSGLPIVVSCAPAQRTIVRPTIVNGVAMSQVECVAAEPQAAGYAPAVAPPRAVVTPVSYRTSTSEQTIDARGIEDTSVVPMPRPSSARPVRATQVVNMERAGGDVRVVRRRSVQKSAVIIGSSSGVGAGVGAAVGGKKGALIGAVMAGGGAAIWDQVTRRRD